MPHPGDIEEVRREPDPIRRGRMATELLTIYQQHAAELARLRRAAIEEAHRDRQMSYTQIGAAMGITKGRVSQIRVSAPPPERAFFGVGPVTVGFPLRHGITDRRRPLIAAEDMQASAEVTQLLAGLALAVQTWQIEPDTSTAPPGDAVVICGPKSAPVAEALLSRDPALAFTRDDGQWRIVSRRTGERYESPADDDPPVSSDIAYVARHQQADRVVVHIAGVHAIGSLGAVRFLAANLAEMYAAAADAGTSVSLVVQAGYDGLDITASSLLAGPFTW